MILHIKNMVCNRCIKVVKEELSALGIEPEEVTLGQVRIPSAVPEEKMEQLLGRLEANGFELVSDRKKQLVEQIKTLIIEMIHHDSASPPAGRQGRNPHENVSRYLADQLGHDYSYLSNLFSATENITIEKYMILQKIERVKELLVYDELSLSEIAWKMEYSSVAHLSAQFKKVTGLTPSHFKKIGRQRRKTLDDI